MSLEEMCRHKAKYPFFSDYFNYEYFRTLILIILKLVIITVDHFIISHAVLD